MRSVYNIYQTGPSIAKQICAELFNIKYLCQQLFSSYLRISNSNISLSHFEANRLQKSDLAKIHCE